MADFVLLEKIEQVSETNTLSVGYTVKGQLLRDIEIGKPIFVARYMRNNVESLGIMNTSVVKSISCETDGSLKVYTENSVYQVKYMTKEEVEKDVGNDHLLLSNPEDEDFAGMN